MDALALFNDGLRQSAHAQAVADRRAEARKSPEQQENERIEKLIDAKVERAMAKAFQGFTIQKGQGITISGSGRNITIGLEGMPGAAAVIPLNQDQWYELELCDGTTLEVRARNIVPP